MIDIERPLTPRTVLILGIVAVLSLTIGSIGLAQLGDERARLATFNAMAEAGAGPKVPLIAPGMAFTGAKRARSAAGFEEGLRRAAAGHRLLVERIELLPMQKDLPALLAAEIAVSGSEADIRRFASLIENATPALRFDHWQLTRTADGEATVRIEALAYALWEPGK